MQQEGSERPVLGPLNEETSKPLNTKQVFYFFYSKTLIKFLEQNGSQMIIVWPCYLLIHARFFGPSLKCEMSQATLCLLCVCVCLHTLRKLDKKLA